MIMKSELLRSSDAELLVNALNSFLANNPGVTLTDAHYAATWRGKHDVMEYSVLIFYYPEKPTATVEGSAHEP